jgi:hypothetical protein
VKCESPDEVSRVLEELVSLGAYEAMRATATRAAERTSDLLPVIPAACTM